MALDKTHLYWVGFSFVKGIGAVRLQALLDYFGDAQSAWEASAEELCAAGLPQRQVDNLLETRARLSLPDLGEKYERSGIQLITRQDPSYPPALAKIEQPPPILYLRGTLELADDQAVALVGMRNASEAGRRTALELAGALVQAGYTVISGLAAGIDAAAHRGALEQGGRTLAVLGCGVDRIYPQENAALAERILEQGALLSEYPPGTPPESYNFPARNRVIAGLSQAVVVVEAGKSSGALITANFALIQRRLLFAVPGSIYSDYSVGTNRLIRSGARIITSPQELIEDLTGEQPSPPPSAPTVSLESLDPQDQLLLRLIEFESLHIDELVARSGRTTQAVSGALVMLELDGWVRQVGPMNYSLARKLPYKGENSR